MPPSRGFLFGDRNVVDARSVVFVFVVNTRNNNDSQQARQVRGRHEQGPTGQEKKRIKLLKGSREKYIGGSGIYSKLDKNNESTTARLLIYGK